MSTELNRKRDEVVVNFEKIDADIGDMDEGPDRDSLARESAALKSEAAAALPEEERLRRYRQTNRAWNTYRQTDRDLERSATGSDEELAARADADYREHGTVDHDEDDETYDGWDEREEAARLQQQRDFRDQMPVQLSDRDIEEMDAMYEQDAEAEERELGEGRDAGADMEGDLDDTRRRDRRRDRDDGHSL